MDIIEVPLHGLTYTWSNKQRDPLLQRIDWFFISQELSVVFPKTYAKYLLIDIPDHVPCLILVQTSVPRPKLFRFENFWMEIDGFAIVFQNDWLAQPSLPTLQ